MENIKKPVPPDFSDLRNEQIQKLYNSLPRALADENNFAKYYEKEEIIDDGSFPTYSSKQRTWATFENTKNINFAIGVLRKPLGVWRDFVESEDSRQGSVFEYFFGVLRIKSGALRYVLLTVNRNVLAKVEISENEENLLQQISGLQIYSKKI